MTPAFIAAVIDTLLPGAPAEGSHATLPSGTAAGVTLAAESADISLLQAIADQAGGREAFAAADETTRTLVLESIAAALPAAFQRFIQPLLMDYYEAPSVLAAMGWRREPPQPQGHALAPFDAALLANVRGRGKLWRG